MGSQIKPESMRCESITLTTVHSCSATYKTNSDHNRPRAVMVHLSHALTTASTVMSQRRSPTTTFATDCPVICSSSTISILIITAAIIISISSSSIKTQIHQVQLISQFNNLSLFLTAGQIYTAPLVNHLLLLLSL